VVSPPSHCDACGTPLRWFENVPIVSWLVQRGRCRTCDAKVPGLYPFLEAAFGAVGIAITVALT
jgi:leader peptidase (prepilin peptidase) / N-methyltransferase